MTDQVQDPKQPNADPATAETSKQVDAIADGLVPQGTVDVEKAVEDAEQEPFVRLYAFFRQALLPSDIKLEDLTGNEKVDNAIDAHRLAAYVKANADELRDILAEEPVLEPWRRG